MFDLNAPVPPPPDDTASAFVDAPVPPPPTGNAFLDAPVPPPPPTPATVQGDFPITPFDWDSPVSSATANVTDRASQLLENPIVQGAAHGASTVLDAFGRMGRTIVTAQKNPDGTRESFGEHLLHVPEQIAMGVRNALVTPDQAPTIEDTKNSWGIGKLATKENFFSTDRDNPGSVEWNEWLRHAGDFGVDMLVGILSDPLAWAHFGLSADAALAGKGAMATAEATARGTLAPALESAAPAALDALEDTVPKAPVEAPLPPQFPTLEASRPATIAEQVAAGKGRVGFGPPNLPFTKWPFGEGETRAFTKQVTVPPAVAPLLKPFEFLLQPRNSAARGTLAYGKRVIDNQIQGDIKAYEEQQVRPLYEKGAELSAPEPMIKNIYGPLHDALNANIGEDMELRVPAGPAEELAKSLGFKTQEQYPAEWQKIVDEVRDREPQTADAIEARRDWGIQHTADTVVPALEKFADLGPEDRAVMIDLLQKGRSIFKRVDAFAEERGYQVNRLNGELLDGPKKWFARQTQLNRLSDEVANGPIDSTLPDDVDLQEKLSAINGESKKAGIFDILDRLDSGQKLEPDEIAEAKEYLNKQAPDVFANANAVVNYRPSKLKAGALEIADQPKGQVGSDVNRQRGGEVAEKYGLDGVKPSTSGAEADAQRGGTGKASMQGQTQLGVLGKVGNWRDTIIKRAMDSVLGRKLTPDGLKRMRELFEQTAPGAEIYEGNALKTIPLYDKSLANGISAQALDRYTAKMFVTQPHSAVQRMWLMSRGVVDEPIAGEDAALQWGPRPATRGELAADFQARPELKTVRMPTLDELQDAWKESGGKGALIDQFAPEVKNNILSGKTKINDAIKGQLLSTGELTGATPYQMTRVNLSGKKSGAPGSNDVWLDTGAAKELERLKTFSQDPFALRNFLGQAAPLVTYASQTWRMMQTVLGPQYLAALARYQMHDAWRMHIGDLADGRTVPEWTQTVKPLMAYLKDGNPEVFKGVNYAGPNGTRISGMDLIDAAEHNGWLNQHGSQGEYALDQATSLEPAKDPGTASMALDWFKRLSETRDNANRLVAGAKLLRDGYTPGEAGVRIGEGGLFDYKQNAASTKLLAQTGLVPFANFYSNAIPFVAHWAMGNPGQFMAAMRAMDSVRNGQLAPEDLPEYMRDTFNMMTGVRRNANGDVEVQMTRGTGWFPLSELTDLLDSTGRALGGNRDAAYNQLKAVSGPPLQMLFKMIEGGKEDEADAQKKSIGQKIGDMAGPVLGRPAQTWGAIMPPGLGGNLGQIDPRTMAAENPLSTLAGTVLSPVHSSDVNVTQVGNINLHSAQKNLKAAAFVLGTAKQALATAQADLQAKRGTANQAMNLLNENDPDLGRFIQKVNQAQQRVQRERAALTQAAQSHAMLLKRFEAIRKAP